MTFKHQAQVYLMSAVFKWLQAEATLQAHGPAPQADHNGTKFISFCKREDLLSVLNWQQMDREMRGWKPKTHHTDTH